MQAVSCDEAFLDISGANKVDPEVLASKIRKEIFDTTGCTASAGIATNMLMARLATRTAKPDGQCYIPSEKVGYSNSCTKPLVGQITQRYNIVFQISLDYSILMSSMFNHVFCHINHFTIIMCTLEVKRDCPFNFYL